MLLLINLKIYIYLVIDIHILFYLLRPDLHVYIYVVNLLPLGLIFIGMKMTQKNLQAKLIKTAAFCHNRALQDLFPDSYGLLFTTGFPTLTASPLSSDPDVQRVQRVRQEG